MGAPDPVFSVDGVRRVYDEARSEDKTTRIDPGAWHDQCAVPRPVRPAAVRTASVPRGGMTARNDDVG